MAEALSKRQARSRGHARLQKNEGTSWERRQALCGWREDGSVRVKMAGRRNNGWREMEDWDELDQGSCWDWIGVGLRKRRPMRFAIHYKIVRVFVYLTHTRCPRIFALDNAVIVALSTPLEGLRTGQLLQYSTLGLLCLPSIDEHSSPLIREGWFPATNLS